MEAGYAVKSVWTNMCDANRIHFGYHALLNYVHRTALRHVGRMRPYIRFSTPIAGLQRSEISCNQHQQESGIAGNPACPVSPSMRYPTKRSYCNQAEP